MHGVFHGSEGAIPAWLKATEKGEAPLREMGKREMRGEVAACANGRPGRREMMCTDAGERPAGLTRGAAAPRGGHAGSRTDHVPVAQSTVKFRRR